MKDLIKNIREYIDLSQSEMASKMGVSFATVNRWENGHSLPTRLAEERLFELCKSYEVPVYDMLIEKINIEVEKLSIDKNRLILYHGSKNGLYGLVAPCSREKCDFGRGFYMGNSLEQPLTLVCDFEDSKFYILSIDISKLKVREIPVNLDWALLVAYHRGRMEKIRESKLYKKYSTMTDGIDLVVGSIANDRLFFVIDNFFQGNITDMALVNSLSALELGKQYVALTQKACDAVKIEKEVELTYFEKKVLQEVSEKLRVKGINFAKEICKTHRRDGKFFDEILSDASNEV